MHPTGSCDGTSNCWSRRSSLRLVNVTSSGSSSPRRARSTPARSHSETCPSRRPRTRPLTVPDPRLPRDLLHALQDLRRGDVLPERPARDRGPAAQRLRAAHGPRARHPRAAPAGLRGRGWRAAGGLLGGAPADLLPRLRRGRDDGPGRPGAGWSRADAQHRQTDAGDQDRRPRRTHRRGGWPTTGDRAPCHRIPARRRDVART